ncbi:type VI secretion system protein TssA [Lysobacter antibioticus]|uniref:ImpA-related N-terminal family protein n=1 Tax=Lysobacter antibioticus TaxID=84531 RepID=A0A0S2FBS8_LYSAN|nr:type VI secretion system protein TssA [Lysobacter antibioticus]ALN80981.1 impA-related N-terminal family protein [Lysobacter antibioticus]
MLPFDTLQCASSLIGPIAPDRPCGENLDHEQDYLDLLRIAAGREAPAWDALVFAAEAPDWLAVEREACGLLARTKDLRIAALLTHAWLQRYGLPGFAKGLELIEEWLDRYWLEVHPRLDVLGRYDPLPRLYAIAAIADAMSIGKSIRNATVLRDRHGVLTLRETVRALVEARVASLPSGCSVERNSLAVDLRDARSSGQTEVFAVVHILAVLARIKARVGQALDPSLVPDFSAIEAPLRVVHVVLDASAPLDGQTTPDLHPDACGDRVIRQAAAAMLEFRSRDDVALALEQASAYLERYEPSHPAPLLIRRALRLMDMNFCDIVRDLVPASLAHVQSLAGTSVYVPAE